MFQSSTATVGERRRRRFEKSTLRLGNMFLTKPDAEAECHGWVVTRRRGGLVRTYRDPRFAAFVECEACRGEGRTARNTCSHCNGHGRRVLPGFLEGDIDPTVRW